MSYLQTSFSNFLAGGLVGVLGCRFADPISRAFNPVSIVQKMTPQFIDRYIGSLSFYCAFTHKWGTSLLHSPYASSCLVAPIVEEIVFRGGIQQLFSTGLTSLGVDPTVSQVASIRLSSLIFARAHVDTLESSTGFSLFLHGAVFGVCYEKWNLVGAIGSHMMNNVYIHYLKKSPVVDDSILDDRFREILQRMASE